MTRIGESVIINIINIKLDKIDNNVQRSVKNMSNISNSKNKIKRLLVCGTSLTNQVNSFVDSGITLKDRMTIVLESARN